LIEAKSTSLVQISLSNVEFINNLQPYIYSSTKWSYGKDSHGYGEMHVERQTNAKDKLSICCVCVQLKVFMIRSLKKLGVEGDHQIN